MLKKAFQAVKKYILHTRVFPGGLLSFSLKPRVKENASTSIISLNNIFWYQHLGFPCLYLCCPDKNSEFFALCDFDGGRHQQPDVFEKDLDIFLFLYHFYVLLLVFSWRTVTPRGAMWLWWGSPATSCFSKQMATLTRPIPMPFGTAERDKDCNDGQRIIFN